MNQCRKRIYDIRQYQLIHLRIQNLFQYSKFKSKRATQEYIYFHVFTEERAQHLASTFGCIIGQLPFTYLGLPHGTTRPAVVDFLPLVCRIERRMAGISSLLSYHGRLIYWLILFFHLCPCTGSAPFPKTVIKQIDSFRKNCLWDGKDLHRQGKCLVPWTAACRPKDMKVALVF